MTAIAANIEAGFSIGDMEGAVHGALKKHHDEKPRPIYLRRTASAIGDGSHLVTLDVGSPPSGRIWIVTLCTLYGTDDHTVVATVVGAIYTGNPNSLALPGLIFNGLAFPSSTQISDDVLWVHNNENLCVQTSIPGAANQQYGVNFLIQEWREHEVTQKYGR